MDTKDVKNGYFSIAPKTKEIGEATTYLATGGMGEVIGLTSLAMQQAQPKVQMDTDLAMALCLLADQTLKSTCVGGKLKFGADSYHCWINSDDGESQLIVAWSLGQSGSGALHVVGMHCDAGVRAFDLCHRHVRPSLFCAALRKHMAVWLGDYMPEAEDMLKLMCQHWHIEFVE